MTIQHTVQGAGAPSSAPPSVGAHYTNTTNGDQYLAKGTASVADWVLQLSKTAADAAYQPKGDYQPAGDYLTSTDADAAYQPKGDYQPAGDYLTSTDAAEAFQPKGNYQAAGDYATPEQLLTKVDKVEGKQLSTEDFTTEEKNKLAELQPGGGGGGQEVGDLLYTIRNPGPDYLPVDGSAFDPVEYPLLAQVTTPVSVMDLSAQFSDSGYKIPATDGAGNWMWANNGGLHRSTDDGITWELLTYGYQTFHDAVFAAGTWIVGGGDGVYRSTDTGETWTEEYIGGLETVTVASDGAGTWLAVNSNGVFRNTADGVGSWDGDFTGPKSGPNVRLLHANGTWICAENAKLHRSTDVGLTWSLVAEGDLGWSNALATDGNGVWIYAAASQLTRSSDDGLTWEEVSLDYGGVSISGILHTGDEFVVTLTSYSTPKVARSTDGLTWVDDPAFIGKTENLVISGTGTLMGVYDTYSPMRYKEGEEYFYTPMLDEYYEAPAAVYIKAR